MLGGACIPWISVDLGMGPPPAAPVYRGVGGVQKYRRVIHFDNFAQIHDRNIIADMAHNAQIMADEQVTQPQIFFQLANRFRICA